ncbi:hypothetical protein C9446_12870 [Providencia heimbachae]|nr:hypothetical protein C9446_12870 [Providencia heimbachae]
MWGCRLRSATWVTYLCMLPKISSLVFYPQYELFRASHWCNGYKNKFDVHHNANYLGYLSDGF